MAKSKLTKEIISFIADKYECPTIAYSFSEIAGLILEKYNVDVTPQAVGKSYRKNKDDLKNVVPSHISSSKDDIKTFQQVEKKEKTKEQAIGFNDDAGERLSKAEIKNLLD